MWTAAGNAAFPLDRQAVQDMANELMSLRGTRQLDGADDLSIYGLSEPAFAVTAAWADGTSTTYAMGADTPFGDGYYVSTGKEGVVYTVEDDLSSVFDTTMNALAVKETIPTVSAATRLTVGSGFDMVKEETSRTVNAGEVWYDGVSGAALDVSKAEELITAAKAITWQELVQPTASDEELATYGVDEANAAAICLYEGETAALTLLVGAQNESGDHYARLPGSAMVYTVAADDVTALLSAATADMPSMVILALAQENVQSAVFTAGERAYTWTPAAEEAEAEAEAQEDPGEALWESLLALEAQSIAEAAEGETLLTVEAVCTDGRTAELAFTEYSAESYAVQVSDRCFLVDAAAVDAIIRSLRAIK